MSEVTPPEPLPYGFRQFSPLEAAVDQIVNDFDELCGVSYRVRHPQTINALRGRIFKSRKLSE